LYDLILPWFQLFTKFYNSKNFYTVFVIVRYMIGQNEIYVEKKPIMYKKTNNVDKNDKYGILKYFMIILEEKV